MQRIGKAARDQSRGLEAAFREADARDHDEQAEVLARMDTAVVAAAAAYGDTLSDKRRRRLALVLKQFYFCGATKREGSTMRITKLREKLGPLAVSERQLKADLQLLALWEFFTSRKRLRGVARRLSLAVIDGHVEAWRQGRGARGEGREQSETAPRAPRPAPPVKTSPMENRASPVGEKTSPMALENFPSPMKNYTGRRPKLPPENKSALKSAAKCASDQRLAVSSQPEGNADGLTWQELAELLGEDEEGLEGVIRAKLGDFRSNHILREFRRKGLPIPEEWLTPLLEAAR
jgi:hypothetical protein